MADILIEGLEMPKKGNIALLLYSDGSVEICGDGSLSKPLYGVPVKKAVALPEHGRCIDADALAEYYDNLEADNGVYTEQAGETADTIRNAPTVLEANNGKDG